MLSNLLPHLQDWANLLIRWTHFIFGISWIGSSFYFMWLDKSLEAPAPHKDATRVEGELWMVHSGGFYNVEKRLIRSGEMPKKLHWFKWEATFTWLSGFFLLWVAYYLTGGANLLDPRISSVTNLQAIGICLSTLIAGWFVYDALYQSKLAESAHLVNAIAVLLLTGVTYFFTHLLSGKAAYIHVGALMGTIMVTNVWVRILPAQQKMIDATARGEIPDYSLGKKAKRRSTHNSYMTFPVLFIMLSNHFPATYAHSQSWVILLLLTVTGAGVRHYLIVQTKKSMWAFIPAISALIIAVAMTAPKNQNTSQAAPVPFSQIKTIIQTRCIACHSANPTDKTFGATAPVGINFDNPAEAKLHIDKIKLRVVDTKTMPVSNKTQMTDEERKVVADWIAQGAPLDP